MKTIFQAPDKCVKQSSNPIYSTSSLLDTVMYRFGLKRDVNLAHFLEVAPPVISKIRHGKLPVGAILMIRIHEKTGMSISTIKSYLPKPERKELV